MKNKAINILLVLVILIGIGCLVYPFVSNMLHERRQDKIITQSKEQVNDMEAKTIQDMLNRAKEYNEGLRNTVTLSDPFTQQEINQVTTDYNEILNLNGDGVIGYIEVPRLDIYETIYHGTSDDVLAKGIGHLPGTSFPIGGTGTHAVLSAHTGLPKAELFTNLPELKEGDIFYLYVLKSVLVYQVDQIKTVEPEDTKDLEIVEGKDYVTLVTCTPYGLNTHRLLVRGTRVPHTPEVIANAEIQKEEGIDNPQWSAAYGKALLKGIGVGLLFVLLVMIVFNKLRKLEGKQ